MICDAFFLVGGLYFLIEGKPTNAPDDATTHFLGLSQSSFIRNNASLTGGAIFTSSLSALGICCDCSTLRVESIPTEEEPIKRVTNITKEATHDILAYPTPCDQYWIENKAGREDGADKIATTTTTVKLCKAQAHACFDGVLVLTNHTSGENLEEFSIELFDAFQNPASGQPKMQLEIKADSANVTLSGRLIANVKEVTSLRDIRLRAPVNSQHNLTLSFEQDILQSVHIQVKIRNCKPGEIEDNDRAGCISCGPNLFNFIPNQDCTPCPENAECSPSTITPEAGFWHSTSKSDKMHECIVEDACSFEGRAEMLEQAEKEAHENSSVLFYNDTNYKQCTNVCS